MSFTTKNTSHLALFLFFITAGLCLRVLGLWYFPHGMEGDEVVVVYWGRKWISEGRWIFISTGELPAWETPSAYIFGALDLMGINPRWGAVGISFLELAVSYLWIRRRAGTQTALIATSFLALMPWHFYFSYVLGPCVAGLWTSLYLLDLKNPFGRIAANVGGLLYYVSFRVVLLWGALKNLKARKGRLLGLDVLSGVLTLGILVLAGAEQWRGFFFKGSYLVTQRGPQEWLHHYLNACLLWFVPPLQVLWRPLSQYSSDDVGFGFANSLGLQTPLSWGVSLFFGWGLYLCIKGKEHRDVAMLFGLAILLVGFSPSFVHFPFILPVVAFIAAFGAGDLLKKNPRHIRWIKWTLMVALVSVVVMMMRFKSSDRWGTFSDKINQVPHAITDITTGTKGEFLWTVGYEYYRARLAADRQQIPFLGFAENSAVWLREIRSELSAHKTRKVFLQATGPLIHPRPEILALMQGFEKDFQERKALFELNFNIKTQKDILIDGTFMGILYDLAD